ncbi:segregation/condensation protein A [archaeon]|nr:segregation/condensation protein A [archaeon]
MEENVEDQNGIEPTKKIIIDENKVIQTIILGSDWQDVLTTLVGEEGMDPLDVDITKLADFFMLYLQKVEKFDFRVPARFILVAAILLRMKTELLLEEEEKKQLRQSENIQPINIDDIPMLIPPMIRMPTRKVTLEELIGALNKAFEFKERKETKNIRMRHAVEKLIEPEVDIELRIKNVYEKIVKQNTIKFSDLVPAWQRTKIVETLLPVLYLSQRSKIVCDQQEMFEDIIITLVDSDNNNENR